MLKQMIRANYQRQFQRGAAKQILRLIFVYSTLSMQITTYLHFENKKNFNLCA